MKPLVHFITSLFAFHSLFWQETLGLNLFLFGSAILVYSFITKIHDKLSKMHLATLVLALSCGLSVILLNTTFSKFMFVFAVVTSHISLQTHFYSVYESLTNGLISFLNAKLGLIPGFSPKVLAPQTTASIVLRVVSLPLIIFSLYIVLFSFGNSVFGSLSEGFFQNLQTFFSRLFSFTYTSFIFLGIVIVRWVICKKWSARFKLVPENSLTRKSRKKEQKHFHLLDLKYEYLMVFTLFSLLNILYLVINYIDVKWVWFQFDVSQVESLKELVHEGVGWLIVTLLVSIFIISYYFRGNLNFYPNNKSLKLLAYGWIIQNGVLAFSVVLRTLYYVQYHGLASKRIGVFLFLAIVLFGLGSLFYKIQKKRNFSFLMRVNSAFILSSLVIASLLPWNIITVQFNLNHEVTNQIDVDNYLDLDPQIYPILYKNLDKIENQIVNHQRNSVRWIRYQSLEDFELELERRTKSYLNKKNKVGWASWSYADQQAITALNNLRNKRHQYSLK